ncbi:MAG: hypothetical protein QXG05_07995 [Nitrososphaerota archaeon]
MPRLNRMAVYGKCKICGSVKKSEEGFVTEDLEFICFDCYHAIR